MTRYADGEPALLDAPSAEAAARWRSICHSLRGACATLGVVALDRQATSFEHDLKVAGADPVALADTARRLQKRLLVFVADLTLALAP